jgi:uncharacterized membrane protein
MDEQQNQNMPPVEPQIQPAGEGDAEKNKAMAIIGYIIPILFFIPLVTDAKNSPFAKFHANQQLNLLLLAIAVNIIGGVVPIIGWFIILPGGSILLIVFAILGIVNAVKGRMKKLPLIGGINIIK